MVPIIVGAAGGEIDDLDLLESGEEECLGIGHGNDDRDTRAPRQPREGELKIPCCWGVMLTVANKYLLACPGDQITKTAQGASAPV